jgi:Leucine-rich repeat (LRR) protein
MKSVSYNGKAYDIVDRKLDLSYSQIKDISKIGGLGDLSDLKELNLSHNHFGEVKGLKKLKNLEKLNLGKCSIKEIKGLSLTSFLMFFSLFSESISLITFQLNPSKAKKINFSIIFVFI